MGFEPTIPAVELAKTVHALERATTEIRGYMTKENDFHRTADADNEQDLCQS
jgi:hypothetical protein